MSADLQYLLWSVILCFGQVVVAAIGANTQVGLPALAGNRDAVPPIGGWAGRAKRAHANMLESLPLFAALVLIAVVAQKTNATTAMGAALFFWARLAYAIVYVVGVPWLRTAVWAVSIVGMLLIALQLL
ncbi:MAG: MAPEG family protein [Reyranellaceae bacterium]